MPERYKLAEKQQPRRSESHDSTNNNNENNDNDNDEGDSPSIPHHHAKRTNSGNPNAFHHDHLAPGGDERYGRPPSEDSQATLVIEESMLARQGAQGIPPEKIREMMQDPNIVTWYGMDDMENPTNW